MRIVQISTADAGGGAEGSARNLFRMYRQWGHESFLAVGRKEGGDADVIPIPDRAARSAWERFWLSRPSGTVLKRPALWVANPRRQTAKAMGREDFSYPGSARFESWLPVSPDIVHCHNLHGGYFDLRILPRLSSRYPVLLDLRDEWLLTGHCAYSLGCDRWERGCGRCPHLDTYPTIRRDATQFNWSRKESLFSRSRVAVCAPSQWLLDRARRAMFPDVPARVIPNGIDLKVFHPGDGSAAARTRLGLELDTDIILYTGHSPFKDVATVEKALSGLPSIAGRKLLFLQLGNDGPAERLGQGLRRRTGFVRDPQIMADHYRAADVFIHAAHAEAFGKTATEAMACATPVVATAVGGLPEQIEHGETGLLVPPADPGAMASAVEALLASQELRDRIAKSALDLARARFGLARQARDFLSWYNEVIAAWRSHASAQAK